MSILTRLLRWGFFTSFFAFVFFQLIAAGGAGQAPQPQYDRTFLLTVYGRRAITGYVKPWIGHTYHWLFAIMVGMLCLMLVAYLSEAAWRKLVKPKPRD